MAIFVYANDLVIPHACKTGSDGMLAVGALLTHQAICTGDFTQIVRQLDGERDPRNNQTLQRGYFQPLQDSDAGLLLCLQAINRHVRGLFLVTFFEEQDAVARLGHPARILRQLLQLSAIRILSSAPRTFLYIPQLRNEREPLLENWQQQLFSLIDQSQLNYCGFKTYYPSITLDTCPRYAAGPIALDLLILAAARARMQPPDNLLMERLDIEASGWHADSDSFSHNYFLGARMQDYLLSYQPAMPDYSTCNGIAGLSIIERHFLNRPYGKPDPVNLPAEPQEWGITDALATSGTILSESLIGQMMITFIRQFDNLPVYSDPKMEGDQWQDLYLAKTVAVRYGIGRELELAQLTAAYNHWRQDLIVNHPGAWRRMMFQRNPEG